nr:hypothetical protein [Qaidamihabitans albus]
MANGRSPAVRGGAEGSLAAVEHLVEQAGRFGLRAPEIALVLGERAASLAEAAGSHELWVRAEALVVHARVLLGHRAPTVGRAVAALRAAEDAGRPELAAQLRTDLAVCARSVGAPLTGLAALRPVLTVTGLSATQRAVALCHLVGCLGTLGRKPELDRVLMEGDRLVSADDALGGDRRLLARALLRVGISAHRRRHGDLIGAADAARTGIGFLDHIEDKDADGGLARVRLVLELVCALLDRGDGELAVEVAQPVLAQPERAASVAPAGWLRLAIATRVHLRTGSADAAAHMLRDAAHSAAWHELHALAARLWLELAHVEERIGELPDAIQCLREARAAEHLHARARSQARALLIGEFGSGEQAPVDLAEFVVTTAHAPVPTAATPTRGPDPAPTVVLPAVRFGSTETAEPAGQAQARGEPVEHTPAAHTEAAVAEPQRAAHRTEQPARRSRSAESAPVSSVSAVSSARTRHDAEHGSVAARSVLDRLGISAGGAGGRRRAVDDDARPPRERERAERDERPERQPEQSERYERAERAGWAGRDEWTTWDEQPGRDERAERDETPQPWTHLPDGPPPRTEEPPAAAKQDEREADDDYGWLPRLRLPPSLAPLDDLGSGYSSPEPASAPAEQANGGGSYVQDSYTQDSYTQDSYTQDSYTQDPYTQDSYAQEQPPDDEPPPGAGLAELLARALAEHRAGTSSAAALVKQLGTRHGDDEPRRINGRHNDD